MHETLVDVDLLRTRLDDPDWVVADCRFNLMDPAEGARQFAEGHIPGAVFADLDRDLSGPVTAATGRHPLPDPAAFAATLSRWGVDSSVQVVAYDAAGGAFAARLWWLLRWLGHPRVALLDGGWPAWQASGGPVSTDVTTPTARDFRFDHPDNLAWVNEDYLLANISAGRDLLLDARATPRFRGEMEPIDPVAGHVPGARNLPLDGNLGADGRFLPPDELRRRFVAVVGERSASSVIHMCGSGVSACHNILAMERAGLPGSRLYAGSWSQWIRDPARPIARGD